jgi:hypothetical protein
MGNRRVSEPYSIGRFNGIFENRSKRKELGKKQFLRFDSKSLGIREIGRERRKRNEKGTRGGEKYRDARSNPQRFEKPVH